jgi:hypothetical protein
MTSAEKTDGYYARLRRKAIERSRKRRSAEVGGKPGPATITRPCDRCGQPVQITAWSVAVICAYCETGVPRPA